MPIAIRNLLAASCLAMLSVAGCGGSFEGPTGPSDLSGATIAGTVNRGNALMLPATRTGVTSAAAPSGMTVTVVGTNITASVDINGAFQITGVPSGNVQLQFKDATVDATIQISGVGDEELIRIEVSVTGATATVVSETRSSGKVSLCHREGNGSYHMISVSANAEPAHREHGDGAVGDPVPADPTKVFDAFCRPVVAGVTIKKSTNGHDADSEPGPSIVVGSPVTWTYVVTNTSADSLTNVAVTDDKGVAVSCPKTVLAAGEQMTCTASGMATLGQYRNVGTVTATSPAGTVTASDVSHYLGLEEDDDDDDDGPKVKLCHRTGNGSYRLIEVSVSAEPAHLAHGDGYPGKAVPGQTGKVFSSTCAVQ